MEWSLFFDESGHTHGPPCYTIGCLAVRTTQLPAILASVAELRVTHQYTSEIKWKRVHKQRNLINLGLDLLQLVLKTDCRFAAIVVNKELYIKWKDRKKREDAFYLTYSQLIAHVAGSVPGIYRAYIDDCDDSYDKNPEKIGKIINSMLANGSSGSVVTEITKEDSKEFAAIQIADYLCGAINKGHAFRLDPIGQKPNWGKSLAIVRMGNSLGLDALHYDTMPNSIFNIWHFPREWRAIPRTMAIVRKEPCYVTTDDF